MAELTVRSVNRDGKVQILIDPADTDLEQVLPGLSVVSRAPDDLFGSAGKTSLVLPEGSYIQCSSEEAALYGRGYFLRDGKLEEIGKKGEIYPLRGGSPAVLIRKALDARKRAYCAYSHYAVGAALQMEDGRIITGANVENSSYPAGVCAERCAIYAAAGQGYRRFARLALVSGPESVKEEDLPELSYPSPCGICRQALREFCSPETFPVIMAKSPVDFRIKTLAELLPESFGPDYLG